MMANTIVRLFDQPVDAVRAIDRLEAMGVDPDHISLVANNREEWYGKEGMRHDKLNHHHHQIKDDNLNGKDDRAEGAAGGATTGGLLGGGVGLLAGLGMLAVPGLGPVVAAGWLASTATGAAVGAVGGGVVGGIVGALTHEGVDKRDADIYAESIRRGGAVVVVRNEDKRRKEIEAALSDYNSTDTGVRGDYYRDGGWAGFDDSAAEWDVGQIEAERARTAAYRPGTRM